MPVDRLISVLVNATLIQLMVTVGLGVTMSQIAAVAPMRGSTQPQRSPIMLWFRSARSRCCCCSDRRLSWPPVS